MTATEIVARWQHLDVALSDPTWDQSDELLVNLLRESWQAAKLGAQAEDELAQVSRAQRVDPIGAAIASIAEYLRANNCTLANVWPDGSCTLYPAQLEAAPTPPPAADGRAGFQAGRRKED